MKKLITIILCIVICLSLGACGNKTEDASSANTAVSETKEETKQPVETDLEITDETVKNLIGKIEFSPSALASLYQNGNLEKVGIKNDLALRLGWSMIPDDEYEEEQTETSTVLHVKDITMKKKIADIFGDDFKYTDKSFNNTDCETFMGYPNTAGTVKFKNGEYLAKGFEGGGGEHDFIYEEVEKAVQSNDQIKIYVKTAFVDAVYDDETTAFYYDLYNSYDFKTNEFKNKVGEFENTVLLDGVTKGSKGNYNISVVPNKVLADTIDKLSSYVFTFDEGSNGDYYLSAFNPL